MSEAIQFVFKGGWILIPIALTSVVAMAVFIERLMALTANNTVPSHFSQQIGGLLSDGRVEAARGLCEGAEHSLGRIVGASLRDFSSSHERLTELAQERGKVESARLERPIEIVGTCSTIAPLLGLLGTVVGMIEAFRVVEEVGVYPDQLAGGIWKALITTAVGLAVAIPSFIFYKILQARLDAVVVDLEARSAEILAQVANTDPSKIANGEAGA